MSLQAADLAHLLIAITLTLVAAHVAGRIFAVLRQPPVIGEILGGLLLGPTVLGLIAPRVKADLFPSSGVVSTGLGVLSELGLLLLMFLSGREVQTYRNSGRQRTVVAVAVTGLVIPFAVGLGVVQFVNYNSFSGPRGNAVTFAIVFGIGIAVTSIPVISRIMLDLGILHTKFARTVLSVALLEDLILYVVLAVVLSIAQSESNTVFGLWSLFHSTNTTATTTYYVIASLVFFAIFMPLGRPIFAVLTSSRLNVVERSSPTAFRLTFLLTLVMVCVLLGINPIFGAMLAGIASASADSYTRDEVRRYEIERAWDAMKKFSLGLFIPLYFAGVGMQLDLVHHFSVLFFIGFLLLACGTKSLSVWLGARLAGESNLSAVNFAVALNARGGPGIVLATVTLSAGVINENFFTILVVLSIVTSEFAGLWLQHAVAPKLMIVHSGGDNADSTEARGREPVPRA